MKIIAPYQITGEIFNIINEAEKYIILVSPFVNFTKWASIITELENAKKRDVKIVFYGRYDDENFKSWEQIEELGIKPNLIKNLHAKLYFNESRGIVTSMNLLSSSSMNAIEFGAIYEGENELEELRNYVKKYLKPRVVEEVSSDKTIWQSKEKFVAIFQKYISQNLDENVYCSYEDGVIEFNAGNKYYIQIVKAKNNLCLTSILSEYEADNFEEFKKTTKLKSLDIAMNRGGNGNYSTIELTNFKGYSNYNFDYLQLNEKREVLEIALTFIGDLNEFKHNVYKAKKTKQ